MADLLYALMFLHELFFFPSFFWSIPSIITPSHHSPHVPLLISPHDRHYFPCPTCCYLPYKFLLPILVLPDYYFFFSLSIILLGFLRNYDMDDF